MNRSIELWIPLMVPGLLIATVGAGDQTPQISSQAESLRQQILDAYAQTDRAEITFGIRQKQGSWPLSSGR